MHRQYSGIPPCPALLFPRTRPRVPHHAGQKKGGGVRQLHTLQSRVLWPKLDWSTRLGLKSNRASYSLPTHPALTPRQPLPPTLGGHSAVFRPSRDPTGGIPERAPDRRPRPPSLWNAARAHARHPRRARARELPASPCSSGSQVASANRGRSRPPGAGLSLPSHGACAPRGRL